MPTPVTTRYSLRSSIALASRLKLMRNTAGARPSTTDLTTTTPTLTRLQRALPVARQITMRPIISNYGVIGRRGSFAAIAAGSKRLQADGRSAVSGIGTQDFRGARFTATLVATSFI